ncbi:NAD(P)-dependent oxidoreductase [Ensifer aridi]|uniref:NAD(P)-dependent oxidoreductase n=1 Tax=Ensifer aridi TaxID=1708715 RepID=UPI000A110F7F|nr:D-isomer specific 2-hydroxyacid dehydrogenase family protein [Ensifer aridi]
MRAIFVDCTEELAEVIESRGLVVPNSVTINKGSPTEHDLLRICSDAEVIFVEHTVMPKRVLDACPTLRAIIFMGTGAGTYIDLEDAARRDLAVYTVPGYGDRAVAEHTLALMFSAARQVAKMDRDIRSGIWSPLGGLQIEGQKIAVLGLGGIGTCVADLCTALGMKVSAWNRSSRDHPAFVSSLDDALAGANIVTLHLSLNEETRGILDERRLRLPATGFILVNTARASLVDERSLVRMLTGGQIGHAALDVFPEEPLPKDNPYAVMPNVTLTAHAAYMTGAAYEELWLRTLKTYERIAAA